MKRTFGPAITLLALVTLLPVGCASVDMVKTGRGYNKPTNPNMVEILKTVPGAKRYTELGTLNASGYYFTDTGKMYNGLRARAADLGADAVIVTSSGITHHQMSPDTQWAQAVAIKWDK